MTYMLTMVSDVILGARIVWKCDMYMEQQEELMSWLQIFTTYWACNLGKFC